MESRAKEFATRYHASIDQRRKYTNEPYISHPAAVVELVRSVPHTEAMLCAAWLHDVVEDTPCTLGKASPAAKTIKLADLIDNTRSIVERDPKFAQIYLAEKALLLEVLREGDATLWAMAAEHCKAA